MSIPNNRIGCKSYISAFLTLWLLFTVHFQVHGGQAELVAVLSSQFLLLQAVAHAEAATHCGHLAVELLPRDFVVETQPAELDLHTEKASEESGMRARGNGVGVALCNVTSYVHMYSQ